MYRWNGHALKSEIHALDGKRAVGDSRTPAWIKRLAESEESTIRRHVHDDAAVANGIDGYGCRPWREVTRRGRFVVDERHPPRLECAPIGKLPMSDRLDEILSRDRKHGVHQPRARQRSAILEDDEAGLLSSPFVSLAIGGSGRVKPADLGPPARISEKQIRL